MIAWRKSRLPLAATLVASASTGQSGNDFLAGFTAGSPGRFVAICTLPLFDFEAEGQE